MQQMKCPLIWMHKSQLIMLQKTRKNEEKMIHKAYYNISVQKLLIFLCHTRIWDTSMKIHQYFLLRNVILTSISITKTSIKNIFSQWNQNKFNWSFTRLLEFKTGIFLSGSLLWSYDFDLLVFVDLGWGFPFKNAAIP